VESASATEIYTCVPHSTLLSWATTYLLLSRRPLMTASYSWTLVG
jgi:hypothetical protein